MGNKPFNGINASTKAISATSVTGNTALITISSNVLRTLKVSNAGSSVAFFRIGTSAQTATVTDTCILNAETMYVPTSESDDNIGVICNAGETTTLYVTSGYAKV